MPPKGSEPPATRPDIACLYARVSTAEQAEGMSLDAQLRALRTYAAQRGLPVVGEYVDRGVSATADNRPEFQRMIEGLLSPANAVTMVLVVHTSRFMRDVELARRYKRELRRRGVRVVAMQQEIADDPNGELMEGVYELFDQHESRIIGLRTRAAMKENARRGFFNGARAPFGFRIEQVAAPNGTAKQRLVVAADEAEIVVRVFQLYLGGKGAKDVAKAMNASGTLYRGKKWDRDRVLRLLREPAVVGAYRWGRVETRTGRLRPEAEHIQMTVTPIVSIETFKAAEQHRRERDPVARESRTVGAPTQLLGGLLQCGHCGQPLQLETSGKRPPGKRGAYRYYNCRAFCRAGRSACRGFRMRVEALEGLLTRHLVAELDGANVAQALQAFRDGNAEAAESVRVRRAALERTALDVSRRILRWEESFENGADLSELGAERLRVLHAQRQATVLELGSLRSPRVLPPFLHKPDATRRLRQRLESAAQAGDRSLLRAYFESLVERVVITDGDAVVYHRVDGLVALLAEKGSGDRLGATPEKVRTHVVGWRAPVDSNQ